VTGHWSEASLVRISEWPYCVYIMKSSSMFLIIFKVNHHVKVGVRVRTSDQ